MNIRLIGSTTESITAEANETLMEALVRHRLPVQNVCNGKGTCGKCKVRMTNSIPTPSKRDKEHLNETELKAGIRLACSVIPQDGMTLELDFEESQDRKEAALLGFKSISLNPGIEKLFVTLSKPTLNDERGDWDRVEDEIKKLTLRSLDRPDLHVLQRIPEVIRANNYELTATIADREILDIEAGNTETQLFGAAVDIGTTSVAVALVDLISGAVLKVVSTENQQTAYGADVISRISYANESRENAQRLQDAIRKTINSLLDELSIRCKISSNEICKMTIVGNTTMHHLFTGLDVSHLAVFPFVSACNRPLEFTARELRLNLNPQAKVHLFANIGSFVGGDTLGAIVGAPEVLEPGNHLLIDLGTNCELFLKTNAKMIACSTAAGPAFEGAGITHGMRAKQGAIESISLSDQGVSCQVIGDRSPIGICGSGLIEGIDEMRKAGVINKQGKIGDREIISKLPETLRNRIRSTGKGNEFVLAYGADQGLDITISQKDVGELQLAKGAVCAGIKTLVEIAGLSLTDLDSVILSGTFASYLKSSNILNIGLVPNIPSEKIKTVGNAAHMGAVRALLNQEELAKSEELYRKIQHIELGGSVTFSKYFMNSMYLERLN